MGQAEHTIKTFSCDCDCDCNESESFKEYQHQWKEIDYTAKLREKGWSWYEYTTMRWGNSNEITLKCPTCKAKKCLLNKKVHLVSAGDSLGLSTTEFACNIQKIPGIGNMMGYMGDGGTLSRVTCGVCLRSKLYKELVAYEA